jgi:hypothetical protein
MGKASQAVYQWRRKMALTKDASTTTQGPEKEGKRFSGKRHPKVVRISEEVQNSE